MRKTLLLSLAVLGGLGMYAQKDITPANYKFTTAKTIPWYPGTILDANILPGATLGEGGVWGDMNFAEYYNEGLFVNASATQDTDELQNAFRSGWSLVDLGGEVGQVLCFAGKDSGIVEYLNQQYPDMSENWSKITVDPMNVGRFNWNVYMQDKYPGDGYMHIKFMYNVYSTTLGQGTPVWTQMGIETNSNGYSNSWNESVNFTYSEDDFAARWEDDGSFKEDAEGNAIWDPTQWKVIEFNQAIGGDWPFRIRFWSQGGNAWNNFAFFIRDFEITFYEGEESPGCNFTTELITVNEIFTPSAGVESLEEADVNAPIEYFNLQGVKVANPEKGIYIKKQGDKAKKVVL